MNKDRAEKILSRPANADAVLISDPAAIYYLTGRWIHPGERFLGLLLSRTEEPKLFLNILFPFEETAGLKIISYSDTDDITELLAKHIKRDWVLGVDKKFRGRDIDVVSRVMREHALAFCFMPMTLFDE